jgi:hypothetical protein
MSGVAGSFVKGPVPRVTHLETFAVYIPFAGDGVVFAGLLCEPLLRSVEAKLNQLLAMQMTALQGEPPSDTSAKRLTYVKTLFEHIARLRFASDKMRSGLNEETRNTARLAMYHISREEDRLRTALRELFVSEALLYNPNLMKANIVGGERELAVWNRLMADRLHFQTQAQNVINSQIVTVPRAVVGAVQAGGAQ